MIINAFIKAVGQFRDPRFFRVLLKSLALTLGLLAAFVWGTSLLLAAVLPDHLVLPFIGEVAFLDNLGAGLGLGVGLVLSVFLMIPVAGVFVGLFVEDVAAAVEARHYPALPGARALPVGDQIRDSLQFVGVFILANMIALIAYLIAAPLAPALFWLVNGWLLGREYFQIVALRRLGLADAKSLRRRHFPVIWVAGTLMAVPLTIPFAGLIVPILGVATFTHLFQRISERENSNR
ncbi:MAG: EI24 domain-containing protein [Paracoccaceae bacterium]